MEADIRFIIIQEQGNGTLLTHGLCAFEDCIGTLDLIGKYYPFSCQGQLEYHQHQENKTSNEIKPNYDIITIIIRINK